MKVVRKKDLRLRPKDLTIFVMMPGFSIKRFLVNFYFFVNEQRGHIG